MDENPTFDPRPLSASEPLRVFVLGSYPAIRAGLRALLDDGGAVEVVGDGAALDPESLADAVVADLSVGDLPLPPSLPAVVLGDWRARGPRPRRDEAARGWLQYDASRADIAAALAAVVRGFSVFSREAAAALGSQAREAAPALVESLTPREQEVLELIAQGLPNKGIALRLGISDHTAKFHVGAVLSKLGAASRAEAVTIAVRSGILAL